MERCSRNLPIDSRKSWFIASVATIVLSVAFGTAWIVPVALKPIATELNGLRSIPALANSLVWLGLGFGGIVMGWAAESVGVRFTTIFGALMIGAGLALSTLGTPWALYIGHGLLIGVLGIGGINAPQYIYISKWFERRRGSAVALVYSGGYIAGALWPPVFERVIAYAGWRQTMLWYAIFAILVIVPAAAIFFRRPPEQRPPSRAADSPAVDTWIIGWPPNFVFTILATASFLCCVPMVIPQGHLIALCGDLGFSATLGATMISVLLASAFISRQAWGAISDRIGGLRTLLVGSACQTVAAAAFLFAQEEIGLVAVTVAFGFGFSGLIPAYILTVRELFPAREAFWRIPTVLLVSSAGMATGGWLAGALYDHFFFYGPAFAVGAAFGIANLALLCVLVWRQSSIVAQLLSRGQET